MNCFKKTYESPLMERTLVELEDGFCAGSAEMENPQGELGEIDNQEINTNFDSNSFKDNDWF
jgi:hypothetical protein